MTRTFTALLQQLSFIFLNEVVRLFGEASRLIDRIDGHTSTDFGSRVFVSLASEGGDIALTEVAVDIQHQIRCCISVREEESHETDDLEYASELGDKLEEAFVRPAGDDQRLVHAHQHRQHLRSRCSVVRVDFR